MLQIVSNNQNKNRYIVFQKFLNYKHLNKNTATITIVTGIIITNHQTIIYFHISRTELLLLE